MNHGTCRFRFYLYDPDAFEVLHESIDGQSFFRRKFFWTRSELFPSEDRRLGQVIRCQLELIYGNFVRLVYTMSVFMLRQSLDSLSRCRRYPLLYSQLLGLDLSGRRRRMPAARHYFQ